MQPSYSLSLPSPPASIFPRIKVISLSQPFPLDGQDIGTLASASVLPMSIQDWFPLGVTGLIPLLSKGSHESSSATQFESNNS